MADIYCQRFELSTGRRDPGWPVNGVPVCQTGTHNERPRIVGTDDGAFITWIDYRNDPGVQPRNRDVYLQYMQSATANPAPGWAQNGIPVSTMSDPDQINPELDVDNIPTPDGQGVVVTYQDARDYALGGAMWRVMVNHIGANTNQLYLNGDRPVTLNAPGNQEFPQIVNTGRNPAVQDRRAIIVWQDDGTNPGSFTPDIMAQALDSGANLLFPTQGAIVCDAQDAQQFPQITLWEHFPDPQTFIPLVTVGWEDSRDQQATGVDIYAGLLDARGPGVMVNPLGTNGDPICQLPYDQTQLAMDNLLASSVINENTVFAWKHHTGTEMDIWYQEVNLPSWTYQQQLNGWPVTEARGDQVLPQASRRVFTWQDGRRKPIPNDNQDDENIYCQTPGECTGATGMAWRDEFAYWTFGEDAENFRFVSDKFDGSTYIVWDEIRYPYGQPGTEYRMVFIQKLDRYGVPRWSTNGVVVNPYIGGNAASLNARLPDVCIDGQGGARVVWEQEVTGSAPSRFNCWTANVSASGVATLVPILWGGAGTGFDYREPRILPVNSPAINALIGCLSNDNLSGFRQMKLGFWTTVPGVGLFDMIPGSPGHHESLIIAWDGADYLYGVSNEPTSGNIDLANLDLAMPQATPTTPIPYSSFQGYDLAAGTTGGIMSGSAILAYAIVPPGGQTSDVFVNTYQFGALNTALMLTNNSPSEFSSHPAIDVDSLRNAGSSEEGALMVWNTAFTIPGGTYHRVESNRVTFPNAWPAPGVPEYGQNLLLDIGLTAPSSPDIARMINFAPGLDGPRGVAVWEGGGEMSPCSPARPTEIYGQHILFDSSLPSGGPQWPQPAMIGPGPGNYHQRTPMVKAAYAGEMAVYWYDSQNGNNGLMGTMLTNLGTTIRWVKRSDAEVAQTPQPSIAISSIWPQPQYANADGVNISCTGPVDAGVSLEIYDMLGRRLQTLFSGTMRESGLLLRFDPIKLGLQAGSYIVRMSSGASQVTRSFVILR
ncbi:MAG: T9SS type A sorting domain-containing protein [Bacteroidia bacterium]|nr:T9SS type A sorting domain-containing protein [Bacteroidia bacterium]